MSERRQLVIKLHVCAKYLRELQATLDTPEEGDDSEGLLPLCAILLYYCLELQFKIKKQLPDAEHDMYRFVMRSKALKCLQQIILSNKEELATWKHGDVPTNQHEFLASLLTEIVNDLDKSDRGADRCVN